MAELINVRFSGTLVTDTPVAVVTPNAQEMRDPSGSKYKQVARRTIYSDGLRTTVPVVPGSTFRGRLRRGAVEVVRYLSNGEKVSLNEFHQNAVGGVKGAGSEAGFDINLRELARAKNPILGLFGAGDPWMLGRATVSDAVPYENVTTDVIGGVRSDDGKRDNDFFTKLTDDAPSEWDAMREDNGSRTKSKKRLQELRRELSAARKNKDAPAIEKLELEKAEIDEASKSIMKANPVSMPIAHEAIPAGIQMKHTISLSAVTPLEAGLFMASWNQFLKNDPRVGQHGRIGYGLMSGEYEVFVSSVNKNDPFAVSGQSESSEGTLIAQPTAGLSNVPKKLIDCMEQFRNGFTDFDFRLVADLKS